MPVAPRRNSSVASLVVEVIDARGNRLTDATVGVRSQLDDFEATLDCHPESALYRSDRLQVAARRGPGRARSPGGQTRTIAVGNADENGFSHLTRDIVVQFRGPRREEAAAIGKELGCRLLRELVYAPTAFVFRWEGPASLRILDVIDRLAARDDVAWAEPSLVVAPQMDAVTPTDTLWAGCWDRQLVGVQDAWQRLQDAGLQTFGDPNILLAVWDTGVQQSGGIPTNADFAGTLSNGAPKNFGSFDFQNMVANNDTPNNGHGSGVAGVATALANNALAGRRRLRPAGTPWCWPRGQPHQGARGPISCSASLRRDQRRGGRAGAGLRRTEAAI
ncbi:MAG: hypothetical protein IPM90_16055 [Austwickia sp.]|nr:hypothetical protein [Austwickia sp.]